MLCDCQRRTEDGSLSQRVRSISESSCPAYVLNFDSLHVREVRYRFMRLALAATPIGCAPQPSSALTTIERRRTVTGDVCPDLESMSPVE